MGIVAFDLAARYPELLSPLVMLDAAIVLPQAARAAAPDLAPELSGPDDQAVIRQYMAKAFFLPADSAERRQSPRGHGLRPAA